MQAILLSIGDELALGQTVDTNSAWLAERLAGRGIHPVIHETIADDRQAIAASIRWAATQADVILVTGGLGPTEDDLTRQSLADALDVDLVESEQALGALERFFASRGRRMAPRNRVQAQHPRGTRIIENLNGSAPGLHATVGQAQVFVMPGVPREMAAMYERDVEPQMFNSPNASASAQNRRLILSTQVHTFGTGESDVSQMLGDLCQRERNPTIGTTISNGICSVRIRSVSEDCQAAQQALEDSARQVEQAVGPIAFGRDDTSLAQATLDALQGQGKTLASAESCTGGLIGTLLTEVPGSSQAYLGGWVTYTNALKTSQLDVPNHLLDLHGAVSEPVVRAMAEGALRRSGADVAVSVSGVAGPDGGTAEKPVGTVWLGLSQRAADGQPAQTDAFHGSLRGDRAMVRDRSAKCALQLVRLLMMGESLEHVSWLRSADL